MGTPMPSILRADHQPSLPHRRVAALSLAAIAALGLSACGEQNTSAATPVPRCHCNRQGFIHRRCSRQRPGYRQASDVASPSATATGSQGTSPLPKTA